MASENQVCNANGAGSGLFKKQGFKGALKEGGSSAKVELIIVNIVEFCSICKASFMLVFYHHDHLVLEHHLSMTSFLLPGVVPAPISEKSVSREM